MRFRKYELTLKIPFLLADETDKVAEDVSAYLSDEQVIKGLQDALMEDYYDDGRYPFTLEQIHHSLSIWLKDLLRNHVSKQIWEEMKGMNLRRDEKTWIHPAETRKDEVLQITQPRISIDAEGWQARIEKKD